MLLKLNIRTFVYGFITKFTLMLAELLKSMFSYIRSGDLTFCLMFVSEFNKIIFTALYIFYYLLVANGTIFSTLSETVNSYVTFYLISPVITLISRVFFYQKILTVSKGILCLQQCICMCVCMHNFFRWFCALWLKFNKRCKV